MRNKFLWVDIVIIYLTVHMLVLFFPKDPTVTFNLDKTLQTDTYLTIYNADKINAQRAEDERVLKEYKNNKYIHRNNVTSRHFSVPKNIDTSFKTYMDYRKITDVSSKQWELQQKAYTNESGLRCVGNDYCVALGSYYSIEIGDRFEITLENGYVFTVILADQKQDIHTDRSNRYMPNNGNVVEFLVDVRRLDNKARRMGDVSYINDNFMGSVVKIQKINEEIVK